MADVAVSNPDGNPTERQHRCPLPSDNIGIWLDFASGLVSDLANNSYAVADFPLTPDEKESAVDATLDVSDWFLPRPEFDAAYMGSESRDKYTVLPTDDLNVEFDPDTSDVVLRCDRTVSLLGCALESFTEEHFGFRCWGRLNGMLRTPWISAAEEGRLRSGPLTQQDYDDGRVVGHLNFLERRKFMVLVLIDCAGGELHLYPRHRSAPSATRTSSNQNADDTYAPSISIPLSSGMVVIFRHDVLRYTFRTREDGGLALQSWILSEPPAPDPLAEGVVSLPLQLHGERAHVQSAAARYPGDVEGVDFYWNLVIAGGDALCKVPLCRWDADMYYCPREEQHIANPGNPGSTYALHGGFCADAAVVSFDNVFFGITDVEAGHMSPGQRAVLEIGFTVLHQAGFSRDSARGLRCGVFLGDSSNDWPFLCESQNEFRMLSQSNCVTSARLSHLVGLRGTVSTTDTACSSSLVAVGLAHAAMRRTAADQKKATITSSCDNAIALGSNWLLSPRMYMLYCGPGMLSPRGRCFTFDSAADGYARGEGCGGLLLHWSDWDADSIESMMACLVGSAVNQDGRSASMTAPNGPAQQMCIKRSMAETGCTAAEISVAECHGTGTALGDPIEISALRAVMDERESPILSTSAKTNIGHLEAAAGIAGLIRCIGCLSSSCGAPNAHLRLLNPHMDVSGFLAYFDTELTDYMDTSGISGVSSFGFGGTNARSDLWGRCVRGDRATSDISTARWLERRGMYYQRIFHYGAPGPHQGDRIYVSGTWDAFGTVAEMEQIAPGLYTAIVVVGETRREQFRIVVNQDEGQVLHPVSNCGGRGELVEGPDGNQAAASWLIDAQSDVAPSWTLYQLLLDWTFSWETGETKRVTWEPTKQVAPPRMRRMLFKHTYSVIGSWTGWVPQHMTRSSEEVLGPWTVTVKIGETGKEAFHIVRDGDRTQCIYPESTNACKVSLPVCGPDGNGSGKHWLIARPAREVVRIELRVVDGSIAVSLVSDFDCALTWRSAGP